MTEQVCPKCEREFPSDAEFMDCGICGRSCKTCYEEVHGT